MVQLALPQYLHCRAVGANCSPHRRQYTAAPRAGRPRLYRRYPKTPARQRTISPMPAIIPTLWASNTAAISAATATSHQRVPCILPIMPYSGADHRFVWSAQSGGNLADDTKRSSAPPAAIA